MALFAALLFYFALFLFLLALFIVLFFAFFDRLRASAPFVPAPQEIANEIPKLVPIRKDEKIIDLGCGDARILIAYEQQCQSWGIGYDLGLLPTILSWLNLKKNKCRKSKIVRLNFFQADLSEADLIFVYLLPQVLQSLKGKFKKELKSGCKIVSLAFPLDYFSPVQTFNVGQKRLFVYEIVKIPRPLTGC